MKKSIAYNDSIEIKAIIKAAEKMGNTVYMFFIIPNIMCLIKAVIKRKIKLSSKGFVKTSTGKRVYIANVWF